MPTQDTSADGGDDDDDVGGDKEVGRVCGDDDGEVMEISTVVPGLWSHSRDGDDSSSLLQEMEILQEMLKPTMILNIIYRINHK